MGNCDNEHGKVAIGQTVGDSADEADDLTINNRDIGDLRCSDELIELLDASNALAPAIRCEQGMHDRQIGNLDAAELHGG